MSVFRIISQIMENEEFEKEKTDNKHNRWYHNVLTNIDIVDAMNDSCYYDTEPKTLNAFYPCISLPSESFLPQRECAGIIDDSEKCEASPSVERYTHHTKKCMGEISEYGSKHCIIEDGFFTIPCPGKIEYVFDIFCKCESQCDERNAIHIVRHTFGFHWSPQEIPEHDESYNTCTDKSYQCCV